MIRTKMIMIGRWLPQPPGIVIVHLPAALGVRTSSCNNYTRPQKAPGKAAGSIQHCSCSFQGARSCHTTQTDHFRDSRNLQVILDSMSETSACWPTVHHCSNWEWLHSMLMATPSTPCSDFQSKETSNYSKATDCRPSSSS